MDPQLPFSQFLTDSISSAGRARVGSTSFADGILAALYSKQVSTRHMRLPHEKGLKSPWRRQISSLSIRGVFSLIHSYDFSITCHTFGFFVYNFQGLLQACYEFSFQTHRESQRHLNLSGRLCAIFCSGHRSEARGISARSTAWDATGVMITSLPFEDDEANNLFRFSLLSRAEASLSHHATRPVVYLFVPLKLIYVNSDIKSSFLCLTRRKRRITRQKTTLANSEVNTRSMFPLTKIKIICSSRKHCVFCLNVMRYATTDSFLN